MRAGRQSVVLLLFLLAGTARADVVLNGAQHVGDGEGSQFTPVDPVRRDQMRAFPSYFHLSQPTTIQAIAFDGLVDRNEPFAGVRIDGVDVPGNSVGDRWNLNPNITLPAGVHSIAPRPGCRAFSGANCVDEDDVSWSSIILQTAPGSQTSNSIMLNRRRHIGDNNEATNDDYGGRYYPDLLEAVADPAQLSVGFTLGSARVLNLIHFYRLRDVSTRAGEHGQVFVDNQLVGELSANGDPLVLRTSLGLSAGAHTLRVVSGAYAAGGRDSISWDDILLFFGSPGGGTPGGFNAVDPGLGAVNGVIRTKIAGAAFTLDIVALDPARTAPLADYQGSVQLQLLDASDDSGAPDVFGCRSSWSRVQDLGALSFTPANGGRRSLTLTYAGVLRAARILVFDPATGIGACSTDAFAIRPDRLDLRASDNDARSPGTARDLHDTGTGGTITHRAGQPFTLRVRPYDAAGNLILGGYDGAPRVLPQTPVAGAVLGALSVDAWSPQNPSDGVVHSNGVRYSEAGTLQLRVEDESFAAVDANDGSTLAQRAVTPLVRGVGRFTPDHFRFLGRAAELQPTCGSFSYEGEPMAFATAPQFLMQAVNAFDQPVLNYEGSLFRFASPTPAIWTLAASDGSGPAVTLTPATVTVLGQALGAGQVRLVFSSFTPTVVRSVPRAPLDLEVQLAAGGATDADGIAYQDPEPLRIGEAADGRGIAFTGNANELRFGRLFVQNGYGSELLPLEISFGTEYAGPGGGFARNLADSCTSVPPPSLSASPATSVQGITAPLVAGLGSLRLAAPSGAPLSGTVTLRTLPASWLLADTDRDGNYAEAVDSIATFGLHREGDRQIYLRETYR